jgi:mannosyltransferase PIG-V
VRGALAASWPALRVYAWSRLALWAIAAATVLAFEDELNPNRGRWDSPRQHELGAAIDVWSRWDSEWYLRIAESGYDWPSSTPAFFPLYPLLVGGVGRLFGGHFVLAGLVVSLAAGAVAFALLYRLVLRRFRPDDGFRAVLYLAVFPTSLFLGAVYAESLFLALAIGTFVLAEERRAGWASVTAGLALLTRPYGVALLPALAVYAWRSDRRTRDLALLGVPVGLFLAFPLALELSLGHGLAFVDAQRAWERSLAPLGPLGGLVQAVGEGDILGPLLALGLVALAVVAWRRLGTPYGVYAIAALALPMALPSVRLGGLYSFPRLALAAFPCLIALALLGRDRRVHVVTVTVLAAWLAVNVVRWALWYWVA